MDELSMGERALGRLLDRSHALRPDEIPRITTEVAVDLGALDAAIYLTDLEQRVLVPFGRADPPLDIDGTLAGRGFRAREQVVAESGRDRWYPLLDGADRVGMLRVELPETVDLATLTRLGWFASIVAELIVTKAKFGDVIVNTVRTKPVSIATELRWLLMPPLTFRNDHVEIAAMLEPAYDVAGDAFDYAVHATSIDAAVFDAMGHGLEAARLANLAVGCYRNRRRAGATLEQLVSEIDTVIAEEFGDERFVTALLCTLDIRTGHTRIASCGHPLPLLLRGTHVVGQVDGDVNVPLGLRVGSPRVIDLTIEPGDRLLLFSDGVAEAQSPDRTLFGTDRLGDLLARAAMADELPAETVRRLTHSVLEHAVRLRDDATLMMIGWPRPLQ